VQTDSLQCLRELAANNPFRPASAPPWLLATKQSSLGRPHPRAKIGAVAARWTIVALAGRATRVPEGAGTSGIQRAVTVTPRRPLDCMHVSDLGQGTGPKLHGMHEVNSIGSD
jgi:hypothetical protein